MADTEEGKMTAAVLQRLLRSDEKLYYRTPSLNTALYVHRKGFKNLGGLEEFTGLRVIYADGNAISEIQGLESCKELRTLCLNDNCIREVPSLGFLSALRVLNLSNNYIQKVEGLEECTFLETLLLAGNRIGSNGVEDFASLKNLQSLTVLDLQRNAICHGEEFIAVAKQMPNLKVLYLQENECVSQSLLSPETRKTKPHSAALPVDPSSRHLQAKTTCNYRRRFIHELPGLNFLDHAPVRESNRRLAAAFFRGGRDEERAEQIRIKNEEAEHRLRLHRGKPKSPLSEKSAANSRGQVASSEFALGFSTDFLRLRDEARRRGGPEGRSAEVSVFLPT